MRTPTHTLLFSVVILISCLASAAPQDPLVFGALIPLSGDFAVLGEANRCGIAGALKDRSPDFKVVYGDSRGESALAVAEYRRLTGQNKDLILFVQRSPSAMAINPLSVRDKVPLLGAAGHPKFATSNPYAWQFWVSSDDEGTAIAQAVTRRNAKNAAIITVDDEWNVTVSNGFRNSLLSSGVKIVMDESVLPTHTDIKPLLLKAARLDADAVFLNVNINQLGVGIKQVRDLGLTYPLYSTFWCATPDVLSTAGSAADGVVFVEMETNFPSFLADVSECAPFPPSPTVLSSYAATNFYCKFLMRIRVFIRHKRLQIFLAVRVKYD